MRKTSQLNILKFRSKEMKNNIRSLVVMKLQEKSSRDPKRCSIHKTVQIFVKVASIGLFLILATICISLKRKQKVAQKVIYIGSFILNVE